jgi:hypothetical protein
MTTSQAHAFNGRNQMIAQQIWDARQTPRPAEQLPGEPIPESLGSGVPTVPNYDVPVRHCGGYVVPVCGKLGAVARWKE